MKARILSLGILALLGAGAAGAQTANPACGGTTSATILTPQQMGANAARDLCVQASDVFQLIAPQLGLALTGGNATLGQGGTLGGLPHFTVGVRGNVLAGDLPKFDEFPAPRTSGNQSPQVLRSGKQVLGLPVVDAAVGVFKGFPLALTNVGGVDLLLSASYVPSVGSDGDDFQIAPESNLQFGYGVRVGLLQESILVPGVSVTWLHRALPTTTISGRSSGSSFTMQDVSIKSNAWRVVASKSLLVFGVAAGVGQDSYDQSMRLSATSAAQTVGGVPVAPATIGPLDMTQDLTRTNVFLDLSMNLPFIKIVGEVGQVSGGSITNLYNSFSGGEPTKSRLYGAAGIRIGL